jgi:regulator of sigma E protease
VLQFAAILSIALALTNLLPLPALDGGRILFVLIEAARGKRLAPEREGFVHLLGMFALLTLMVVMVINDLVNPVVVR